MENTGRPAATSSPVSEAASPQPVWAVSAAESPSNSFVVDVVLRVLLFAAAVSAVVVLATSKQTVMVPVPGLPSTVRVPMPAKFNLSPAFIYLMAALSTTCLYSIITTLASISLVLKPSSTKAIMLVFALFDVVFVGIVASATGTAGGVAYIGLRGNSHVRWNKISGIYDKFIRHIASAVTLSGIAAILLVMLTVISIFRLYKRIP